MEGARLVAGAQVLLGDCSRFGIDGISKRYARLVEVSVAIRVSAAHARRPLTLILLGAWLSDVTHYTTAVLAALSLAYIANVSPGAGFVLAAAAADPGIAARTSAGTAVASLAFTAGLAPVFGMWDILSGTVIALTGEALL